MFTTVVNATATLMSYPGGSKSAVKYNIHKGRVRLITPVGPTPDLANMLIVKCPPKVARGAYKPRMANRGDAPTSTHAAQRTGVVCDRSQHEVVRVLAKRGY